MLTETLVASQDPSSLLSLLGLPVTNQHQNHHGSLFHLLQTPLLPPRFSVKFVGKLAITRLNVGISMIKNLHLLSLLTTHSLLLH